MEENNDLKHKKQKTNKLKNYNNNWIITERSKKEKNKFNVQIDNNNLSKKMRKYNLYIYREYLINVFSSVEPLH